MRSTAQIDDVELIRWRKVLILEAIEDRVFQLGRAEIRTEGDTETLLTKVGVAPAVVAQSTVLLEAWRAVGEYHLNRGLVFAPDVTGTLVEEAGVVSDERNRRHRLERV